MSFKIIRLPEVLNKVGISRASLYEFISEGAFPRQVKLGARSVGWLESEIDDWVKVQVEKSRATNQSSKERSHKKTLEPVV